MTVGTRPVPARQLRRGGRATNLQRAIRASGWMYSSRALVFGWALLLTHQFGIAGYGVYAMAFAAGAVLGVPLDSYFTTRGPRVASDVFVRERTTRALFGFALVLCGVVLWPLSFLAGFAVVKAGSDVAFQASRSSLVRNGHPDKAQRADAVRQVIGLAVGIGYLLLSPSPSLEIAALLYLAGSALPIAVGIQALTHARPALPEVSGRSALILAESIGGVAYVHAEVILLGLLVSESSAGYYSFGATIVWSLAALGQSFGTTFHEPLRHSRGDVGSGPPLHTALWLSAATACLLAAAAAALWAYGVDQTLWLTFACLAPVSFLRTLSSVATVVLVLQHRDRFRLVVTVVSVSLKIGLILLLQEFGGPGAALAFLASDLVMSGSYAYAVYGRRDRELASA
jgi:O-antigen/teichoic acid export membrane protein